MAKVFEEMLHAWDRQPSQQGCRVLLCFANFCGSPLQFQLDNIQLAFFPPNTTANSRPMDQGITENLKHHYKKILRCCRLEAIDLGKGFEFTLLDALHVVWCAWEQVGESTSRNCFAEAKFIKRNTKLSQMMLSCSTSHTDLFCPVIV